MDADRLEKLEKEIEQLKIAIKTSNKPKKEKTKKEPSEYNKFVKKYIESKKLESEKYDHKTAFKEAALEWSKKNKSN